MKSLQRLAKNIINRAISTYLVTVTNLLLLLTSHPTLANPTNLESLQILHPTIIPEWLSWGK
ncbi:hypothetical protein IQ238_06090 [Pleurocapsales cyanobacterium LEGE 06147]|nr:hypothetical protein [Pleurocapsales cyanobacterium LEGE 06147]